jgi:hypothetical protein
MRALDYRSIALIEFLEIPIEKVISSRNHS